MPLKPLGGILGYFGGKRTLAPQIVSHFGDHSMYYEPMAGSLAVLLAKPACQLEVVSEKNPDVANLIRCLADEERAQCLFEATRSHLVSETMFREAAERLSEPFGWPEDDDSTNNHRAKDFLLVSWQGPSGLAGTTRKPRFAVRNTTSGGSLAARWAAVAPAIPAWHERLRNVEFRCKDAFELLKSVPDQNGCVIYCDPPYFADSRTGGDYACDFTDAQHNELFLYLSFLKKTRVVVSYYDSPSANLLYDRWRKVPLVASRTMKHATGGSQESVSAAEVLFINQPE